jgi:glutaryl-CoA dehydrogenase
MAYKPLDFFNMDALLSEDERMIRDTAREFTEREVLPIIADCWEEARFPAELIPKMAELGFLGPFIPEEYGGVGASYTIYGLICQELERGDSGIRSFCSVQGSLVMYPIWKFGSEEQRRTYLPRLASGEIVGCFGLTEPDAGSDPGSMKTRCRRDGDTWILKGNKMWITNGTIADIAIVWAKDEEGRIRGFIVHKDDPGFSAPEQRHKVSLRASVTSELVLDDVRVPAERELPNTEGLKSPLMCLTSARYGIAWGAVGVAQAVFDEALQYSLERVQFGRPIASFQLTQRKLADMATEITKAQMLAYHLGRLADKGEMKFYHVSMAKRNNVAVALMCAREARAILGANGISLEYQAIRHMCNMESVHTYEGTYEVHTLILGETLTGIPAYRG